MKKVQTSDLEKNSASFINSAQNYRNAIKNASFLNIFAFLKKKDAFLLLFACIISIINGFFKPYMTFLLGRLFHAFSLISLKEITEKQFKSQIDQYILHLLVLAIASFIGGWLFQSLWHIFAEIYIKRVYKKLFSSFASKEFEWYDSNRTGISGLINRCEKDIQSLHYTHSNVLGRLLSSFITLVISLFLAFWYSWKLTFAILVSLPVVILIAAITSYFIGPYIYREKEILTRAATHVNQAIVNMPIVKIFNAQQYESRNFDSYISKSSNFIRLYKKTYSIQQSIIRFFVLVMFIQGFWYGTHLVITNEVSSGNVLTVFWACLMISFSMQTIIQLLLYLKSGIIASYDLQNIFKDEKNKKSPYSFQGSLFPEKCHGKIVYDLVSFAYPLRPEKIILKDVSLVFPAGKTTFIVGSSGSGKSTLAALLIKIYKPDSGSIYIDNKHIGLLNTNWVRNNVTLIEQPVIFNETLKLNITLGKPSPDLTDISEIKNASRMALLEEMIYELPDGYDTRLGMNGMLLSNGQMQRVAIARARFRDTPILILDESTSSLDYINRSLIYDAIRFWRKNKTTIIITHDMSQIKGSDYIYVMNDGFLVQKGFKNDLLEDKNGTFFNVYSQKKGDKIDAISPERIHSSPGNISKNMSIESFSNDKPQMDQAVYESLKTKLNKEEIFLLNSGNITLRNRRNTTNIRNLLASNINNYKSKKEYGFLKKYFRLNISLWNILKNNWSYINKKTYFIIGLLFCIGNGISTPLFSYTLSKLLALFFSSKSILEIKRKSLQYSMIILGVSFFDSLTLYLKIYLLEYSADSWITNIRSILFKNILFQDIHYFSEGTYSSENTTRIIINETELMRTIFGQITGNILVAVVMVLAGVIWSFVIAWKLSIIIVGVAPLLYISIRLNSYLNTKWDHKYKDENINAMSILYEFSGNIFTVKALLLDNFFQKKFMLSIKRIFVKGIRKAIYIGFGYGIMESIIFSFEALLFFYGSRSILNKTYTPIVVLTIFSLIIFSVITAAQFLSMVPQYNKVKKAYESVNDLFNISEKNTENKGSLIVPLNGEIIFKNIFFSYPGHSDIQVLENINLKIENNEKIALVGLSGSGKSTMISLIQKLYQAHSGFITINGHNISSIETKWLRNHIAVVRQTPMLFNRTIEQNIAYGLDSFNISDVRKAAQKAAIDDFIIKLPDGYNTILGDYGRGLSTGQAQRVSLARAFIRNPRILILDECTSSLDSLCASSIQEIIKNITNMTVIIVTHSKEMMKLADKIVLLKSGRIAETGTYDELIKMKKDFWTLIQKGQWI
ncbi:hypothetical protein PNEG_03100 [Pneumocystis murina B123]|uniref:Uncharacterized protein n=1 Tax=Pneumocystis murina (strain B123) TaxID=1069680 RepID=M7NJ29_PNEMU|nr:hypothetical protein PNEG_03100 [Pneumocystis murina B123]EMR08623.1 hypothetical protein PNEG_03100 [Pneumocystis murina B123]